MAEKHFSTIQIYAGDSISSIVNECITLNFKGAKIFLHQMKNQSRWNFLSCQSLVAVACLGSADLDQKGS